MRERKNETKGKKKWIKAWKELCRTNFVVWKLCMWINWYNKHLKLASISITINYEFPINYYMGLLANLLHTNYFIMTMNLSIAFILSRGATFQYVSVSVVYSILPMASIGCYIFFREMPKWWYNFDENCN